MQILAKVYTSLSLQYAGYIAGSGDGIVTIKGVPSSRFVYLLDATNMQLLQRITSLKNGHYMFLGLNTSQEYLVMVRDYKRELEPFAWDYVQPADDLTIDEQMAIQASWQT